MKTCMICLQTCDEGIDLLEHCICLDCEEEMIQITPSDPFYLLYIDKLKRIALV